MLNETFSMGLASSSLCVSNPSKIDIKLHHKIQNKYVVLLFPKFNLPLMKPLFFTLLVCLISQIGFAQKNNEQQIRNLLDRQVAEWNKGNIEGYMKGYWENDSLVFIGKNGPTYGYESTLARYQKSYPDAVAMGQLTSTVVSMEKLSDKYYFIIGKWHLSRAAGDLSGSYTLLLKKIKGTWVIVVDHSS